MQPPPLTESPSMLFGGSTLPNNSGFNSMFGFQSPLPNDNLMTTSMFGGSTLPNPILNNIQNFGLQPPNSPSQYNIPLDNSLPQTNPMSPSLFPQPGYGMQLPNVSKVLFKDDFKETHKSDTKSKSTNSELEHKEQHQRMPSSQSYSYTTTTSQPGSNSNITKLLLLVSLAHKQNKIDSKEKGIIKDLILEKNETVYSALEVFEIDHDIEEFIDTVRRICVHIK